MVGGAGVQHSPPRAWLSLLCKRGWLKLEHVGQHGEVLGARHCLAVDTKGGKGGEVEGVEP
jgi:hypothetical protein